MKLARMRWSGVAAVEFCKATPADWIRVVEHAVPSDARFIRAATDEHGWIWVVIESESFSDVPEGQPIPELPATTFQRVLHA